MVEPLFRRICVATDGSPFASHAVDVAIDLAGRYAAELTILAVAPLVPIYVASTEAWVPTEVPESEIRLYQEIVDKAVERAKAAGLKAVTGVGLEGVVVDEIVGYLETNPTDLLVLGSRGLGAAKRLLLGSVSDAVSHHAGCPVLLVRSPAPPKPSRS